MSTATNHYTAQTAATHRNNILQIAIVSDNVASISPNTATHHYTSQHPATHRNILQNTAAYCNTLARTATYCYILQSVRILIDMCDMTHRKYHRCFPRRTAASNV